MAAANGRWSSRFPVYQVDFQAHASGKRLATTKRRIRWRFGFSNAKALDAGETGGDCRGEEHDVTIVWSVTSGKRLILADGHEVHYSTNRGSPMEFSWTMKGNRVLKVVAHAAQPLKPIPGFRQYDFFINGQSFFHFPKVFELGLKGGRATGRTAVVQAPHERYRHALQPSATAVPSPYTQEQEDADLRLAIEASLEESKSHLQQRNPPPALPAPPARPALPAPPPAYTNQNNHFSASHNSAPAYVETPAPAPAPVADLLDFASAPSTESALVVSNQPQAYDAFNPVYTSSDAAQFNSGFDTDISSQILSAYGTNPSNETNSSSQVYKNAPPPQPPSYDNAPYNASPSQPPSYEQAPYYAPSSQPPSYEQAPYYAPPSQPPSYEHAPSSLPNDSQGAENNATADASLSIKLTMNAPNVLTDEVQQENGSKNPTDDLMSKLVNMDNINEPVEKAIDKLTLNPFAQPKGKSSMKSRGLPPTGESWGGPQPSLAAMKNMNMKAPSNPKQAMYASPEAGALVVSNTQQGNFGGYGQGPPPVQRTTGFGVGAQMVNNGMNGNVMNNNGSYGAAQPQYATQPQYQQQPMMTSQQMPPQQQGYGGPPQY